MAQRLNYMELAPEGMAAMSSVEHVLNTASGLESGLLEMVRLRASLMNECEYCVGLHTHELTKRNETAGRIGQIAGWRESDAYTERERAALAWTEAVTDIQAGHAPDEAYAAVREHFAEKELVELTIAIASINAWNRMGIAFRAERRRVGRPGGAEGSSSGGANDGDATTDDGGKVSAED